MHPVRNIFPDSDVIIKEQFLSPVALLTADLITYKLFPFTLFQNGSFQVFLFSSYKLRKCLICSQDWKCYITRNIFTYGKQWKLNQKQNNN